MNHPWKNLIQRMRSSVIMGAIFLGAAICTLWIPVQRVIFVLFGCIGARACYECMKMTGKKKDTVVKALVWFFLFLGLASWFRIILWGGWKCSFFLLLICVISDTVAYVAGSALGGAKIFPKISPGKTWSGSLSALLFSSIAGAYLGGALWECPIGSLLPLSFLIALFSQVGDALESATKRFYAIKDSGSLFPGHGGILDRIDSWLGAGIVFALLKPLLGQTLF